MCYGTVEPVNFTITFERPEYLDSCRQHFKSSLQPRLHRVQGFLISIKKNTHTELHVLYMYVFHLHNDILLLNLIPKFVFFYPKKKDSGYK